MLTNPNTLGLFDENIEQIAQIMHDVGATLYYDGANLNAVMGISRPGDMGFDIVHFNLHKSFTQPHGGGGPGAGPIAVSDRIEPFLPRPQVVRNESSNGHGPTFDLDYDRPKSIGRLRGFHVQLAGTCEERVRRRLALEVLLVCDLAVDPLLARGVEMELQDLVVLPRQLAAAAAGHDRRRQEPSWPGQRGCPGAVRTRRASDRRAHRGRRVPGRYWRSRRSMRRRRPGRRRCA